MNFPVSEEAARVLLEFLRNRPPPGPPTEEQLFRRRVEAAVADLRLYNHHDSARLMEQLLDRAERATRAEKTIERLRAGARVGLAAVPVTHEGLHEGVLGACSSIESAMNRARALKGERSAPWNFGPTST